MKFRIVTAETIIDLGGVVNTTFHDKNTWADADILIVNPPSLVYLSGLRSGQEIQQIMARRRLEVEDLLNRGKVVCVYMLPQATQSWAYDMRLNRLAGKTDGVNSNYGLLPLEEVIKDFFGNLIPGNGIEIRLAKADHPFAKYFQAFKTQLSYEACLSQDSKGVKDVFLKNKAGNSVGFTYTVEQGTLVFVPRPPVNAGPVQLADIFVECARPYLAKDFRTPPPDWAKTLGIPGEAEILTRIQSVEKKRTQIEKQLAKLSDEQNKLGAFRGLLYEQGGPLEDVVLRALNLMGFTADRFKQDDMEHDVVMESNEGRALAEIEGKDKKSINIDKVDQLSRIVDEDFSMRGEYSHGVLVGNSHRMLPLDQRGEPFTEKARKAAERKQFGLLTSAELFKAVVKVLENPEDEDFKLACRRAILETKGKEVFFPIDE